MYRTTAIRLASISTLLIACAPIDAFAAPLAIGIHIATDQGTEGSSTGEQPQLLGSSVTAGVVPISNWNDFVITRFTNGEDKSSTNVPTAQSIPTSATPFTLNDSSGAPTTAQVTAWSGNNTFDVYGDSETSANPNAQLVNGFLGTINSNEFSNHPATFTVSGVPYSGGYDAYVYFNDNTPDIEGSISLTSGSYALPTFYFSTVGPESPTTSPFFLESVSDTAGLYSQGNYVEFALPAPGSDGSSNAFTVTIQTPAYVGAHPPTPGIAAIELVPIAPVPEPSTLAILLVGLIAAWPVANLRRRSASPIF